MSQQDNVPCTQVQSSTQIGSANGPPVYSFPLNQFVAMQSPMPYIFPPQLFPSTTTSHSPFPLFPTTTTSKHPFPALQTTPVPISQPFANDRKKRPSKKNDKECPAKKIKQSEYKVSEGESEDESGEDESAEEDEVAPRVWPAHHIVALLHARCEMMGEFLEPPKQGLDLWKKVCLKVVATCPEFKKNTTACRKKFQRVFKHYQKDVAWNSIPGHDRRETCPYYKLLDGYFANVKTHVHAGAVDVKEACGGGDDEHVKAPKCVGGKKKTKAVVSKCLGGKKKTNAIAMGLMEEVVSMGKELSKFLQRHQEIEAEKLRIMREIQKSFSIIAEKI